MQVFDVDSGKVVGEIPDTPGIHGVALAPDLGRGFTSNGRDSSVTIFDLKTLAVVGRVHVEGRNPDAILYEPVTKRVFVFNGGSQNATAIDAATGTVAGTVVPRRPAGVRSGRRERQGVREPRGQQCRGRLRREVAQGGVPLAAGAGEGPSGIALDRVHHRLFSVCSNEKMVVLDSGSGKVIAALPIGKGADGAEFDPATGLAFSPNGEGTLTVIHEDSADKFTVVGTVTTQRGARTMALDPRTHRIYLAAASYGEAPAPTADRPHPRPPMLPDSFVILALGR